MKRTIAFVPVRCGSKSIPLKNIKSFCDKPLMYWVLNSLQNSCVNQIILATDCNEIEEIANLFNFDKLSVYQRDKENAEDTSSTESVMLEYISKNKFSNDDLFILAQATSPFTTSSDFDDALKHFENEKIDSLLSVVRMKRFYWNENGTAINYEFNYRPRRQDFNGTLMENGAFYINSIKNIKEHKNRLSGNISCYEMPEYSSVEIDEEVDWIIAEEYMRRYVLSKEISSPSKIKLFLSDVDGTLTDAGMYYTESGDELKKFNTHDGKGFELLRNRGIKTGIITSENTKIVEKRAKKLKVDYLYQGLEHKGKLDIAKLICEKEGITLREVAYIGDDINCQELLENVGYCACPSNALEQIKNIPSIMILSKKGGNGAVREFIDLLCSRLSI